MKLIKFKLEDEKYDALQASAAKIHGTVPQLIKLAVDTYLKSIGHAG